MTRQLSASSVHAAMRCGYPFRVDVRTIPRPAGAAAAFGTSVHAALESHIRRQPFEWPTEHEADGKRHLDQALRWLASSDEYRSGMPELVETGIIYDVAGDTAAWGPRRGEDGYDQTPPGHIRGTLDMGWPVAFVLSTGPCIPGVVIIDLKTGKKSDHSMQLATLAVGVSRALGVEHIRVSALYTRLTKAFEDEVRMYGPDDLDAHAGTLHRLMRTLPVAQPTPGDHCRWCEVHPDDCEHSPRRAPDYDDGYEMGEVA